MNKIKFNSGIITKLSNDFYLIELFNAKNQLVYKTNLDGITACNYIEKYKNITLA